MTTTSLHPGHGVSGTLNSPEWGDGYTESDCEILNAALVEKFEELARQLTGDESISYHPYTSEILYECWGTRTREHGPMAPKHTWKINEDDEVEWADLAREASDWVASNIESILGHD